MNTAFSEMNIPRLAVVIVTYNRLAHLKEAVAAVLAESISSLIIVDNGSTDGTREWLFSLKDERLFILTPEKNLGGAGGFETGFETALQEGKPDWIVCFDDDARPVPGALDHFLSLNLEGIDSAAAAVYYPDGSICEMNRPSWNPFWHGKKLLKTGATLLTGGARDSFHVSNDAYQNKKPVRIDSSSFVGFFVRAAWVKKVGLPRGELFIYGDDIIYSLTLGKAGARHYFLPGVRFEHDCSTFRSGSFKYDPLWKAYYTYRNGLLIYRLAAGPFFIPVAFVKAVIWGAGCRHYTDKKKYLKLCYDAYRDAFSDLSNVRHEDVLSRY